MAAINIAFIREHSTVSVKESGVRLVAADDIADIPTAIERGEANAMPLAAWRIAELRETGDAAYPRCLMRLPDRACWIEVVHVDGTVESVA